MGKHKFLQLEHPMIQNISYVTEEYLVLIIPPNMKNSKVYHIVYMSELMKAYLKVKLLAII